MPFAAKLEAGWALASVKLGRLEIVPFYINHSFAISQLETVLAIEAEVIFLIFGFALIFRELD